MVAAQVVPFALLVLVLFGFALDADQRTVTTRKIMPGKKANLKLPVGFGPYTAPVKAESQSKRPIAFSFSSESPAQPAKPVPSP